jgi:hypothetical protein
LGARRISKRLPLPQSAGKSVSPVRFPSNWSHSTQSQAASLPQIKARFEGNRHAIFRLLGREIAEPLKTDDSPVAVLDQDHIVVGFLAARFLPRVYLPLGIHQAKLDEVEVRFLRASQLGRVQIQQPPWLVKVVTRGTGPGHPADRLRTRQGRHPCRPHRSTREALF